MTLSDPLLKELKGHIKSLVSSGSEPYGDENETVFLICHCLESIFLKGLVRYDGFSPWKTDCFQWFYQLIRKYHRVIPLVFKVAFDVVLSDTKTKSHIGKTRLLIRTCLKRRCLYIPLQLHIENQDYNDSTLRVNHNPKTSILGHEILSQIFLSLLMQMSNYEFNFDLTNSSFLDESWQIPALVNVELVPCDKLGLTLGFPLGFAIIIDILENSLASEIMDKIDVGDIVDEINGSCVRNYFGSKIESMFKKCRSQPFRIKFIKGRDPKKGQVYLPIIKLYRILGLDPDFYSAEKSSNISEEDQELSHSIEQDILSLSPEKLERQLQLQPQPCCRKYPNEILPTLTSASIATSTCNEIKSHENCRLSSLTSNSESKFTSTSETPSSFRDTNRDSNNMSKCYEDEWNQFVV